jgi:tetratricopeptide (TPR) repeat protein
MKLKLTSLILLFFVTSCSSSIKNRTLLAKHNLLISESMERVSQTNKLSNVFTQNNNRCLTESPALVINELSNIKGAVKSNFTHFHMLASCHYLLGDYEIADLFFTLSYGHAKTRKQKSIVLNNRALILIKNKKFQKAKQLLSKSIQFNPNSKTPKFNLASLYISFNHVNNSLKLLNEIHNPKVKDRDVLFMLAVNYLLKSNHSKSLYYFKQIPIKYQSEEKVALFYSYALFLEGEVSKAWKTFNAITTDESFKAIARNVAAVLYKNKQF